MNALIDGAAIETREDLHDALSAQLSLPDWYGRTLDALYDCLGDIRKTASVRVVHADTLTRRLGDYAVMLRCVLADAALENEHLTIYWED